jgi:hypothetical protein
VAHHLHPFVGEVTREAAQRETGAIHRRLADDAVQTRLARDEPHFQRFAMFLVELFNGDGLAFHKF